MAETPSGRVLSSYHKKLKRLSQQTQAAGVAAEDALGKVEDRERHRVARTAETDNELRDKYRGLREGR